MVCFYKEAGMKIASRLMGIASFFGGRKVRREEAKRKNYHDNFILDVIKGQIRRVADSGGCVTRIFPETYMERQARVPWWKDSGDDKSMVEGYLKGQGYRFHYEPEGCVREYYLVVEWGKAL
jgi:hypothetical protein